MRGPSLSNDCALEVEAIAWIVVDFCVESVCIHGGYHHSTPFIPTQ